MSKAQDNLMEFIDKQAKLSHKLVAINAGMTESKLSRILAQLQRGGCFSRKSEKDPPRFKCCICRYRRQERGLRPLPGSRALFLLLRHFRQEKQPEHPAEETL